MKQFQCLDSAVIASAQLFIHVFAKALEDDAAMTQKKMEAANHLITALAGEEARWTEQSNIFDDQINRLIGDCAIASRYG